MAVRSAGQARSISGPVFVRLLLLSVPHPLLRSLGMFGCKIPILFQLNRGERGFGQRSAGGLQELGP